jgi:hypothetical protein
MDNRLTMRRFRLFICCLCACGFAFHAIGSVAAEAVPAERPAVHIGDIWKYRTVDGYTNETTNEFSHRIVDLSDQEITVQLKNKNSSVREQRFFTREWNSVDIGNASFKPYYPEYKFPLAVGQEWKQEFKSVLTSGAFYTGFVTAKITAFEKVTVPAGSFDAYKIERNIESRGTDANSNITTGHVITWYAPAIGKFVRREMVNIANGRIRDKSVEELVEFLPSEKIALPQAGHSVPRP